MNILFASGDVGGARALAPVIARSTAEGHRAFVLRHGALVDVLAGSAHIWVDPTADPNRCFIDAGITHLAFTTSVKDERAADWAEMALRHGIPCLHLLDNWSNYATRLLRRDGYSLRPDLYAVMDAAAATAATKDGVDPDTLLITGTPALAHVAPLKANPTGPLIFVSEPVSQDQGRDPESRKFRGYTEDQVLNLALQARSQICPKRPFWVFTHPRETPDQLVPVLKAHGIDPAAPDGGLAPQVNGPLHQARETLWRGASVVIGMASILLYENWLAGRPTLSVQPNIQIPHLRYLQGRPGLAFCDSLELVTSSLDIALQKNDTEHHLQSGQERLRHENADIRVLQALAQFDPRNSRVKS